MSSLICLMCKEPVMDMRSAISVNKFKNLAAMHLVHKSCYFCSKCSTPLNSENAFMSDESKLQKVVLFRNKKYGMPEAVIQILPNRKNSINFGHLNFWTHGSKYIQAFLCIYHRGFLESARLKFYYANWISKFSCWTHQLKATRIGTSLNKCHANHESNAITFLRYNLPLFYTYKGKTRVI